MLTVYLLENWVLKKDLFSVFQLPAPCNLCHLYFFQLTHNNLKRLSTAQKKPASETVWMEAGFLHPVPSLTTLVKLTSSNLTYCEETQQYLMHHLS